MNVKCEGRDLGEAPVVILVVIAKATLFNRLSQAELDETQDI